MPVWARVVIAAIIVLRLAVGTGVVVVSEAAFGRPVSRSPAPAPAAAGDAPVTPYEKMVAALNAQAAALDPRG